MSMHFNTTGPEPDSVSTSGIVVTLTNSAAERTQLLEWLADDPRIDVGPVEGSRLPITVQHDTPELERTIWRAIEAQPAVTFMNLVFHHLDAPAGADTPESNHDA